jgi:hypothetical protein
MKLIGKKICRGAHLKGIKILIARLTTISVDSKKFLIKDDALSCNSYTSVRVYLEGKWTKVSNKK